MGDNITDSIVSFEVTMANLGDIYGDGDGFSPKVSAFPPNDMWGCFSGVIILKRDSVAILALPNCETSIC